MVAHKDGAAVKLVSRQGVDHTRRFPAIVAAIRASAAPTLVLDGEVAVFDRALVSRFEWLWHAAPPELATPPIFMAFDCLYCRGQDLRARPLVTRRLLAPSSSSRLARLSQHRHEISACNVRQADEGLGVGVSAWLAELRGPLTDVPCGFQSRSSRCNYRVATTA